LLSDRVSSAHLGAVAGAAAVGLVALVGNYHANIRDALADDLGLLYGYYLPLFGLCLALAATAVIADTYRKQGLPPGTPAGLADKPWVIALAGLLGGGSIGAFFILNFSHDVAASAPGTLSRLAGYFAPTLALLAAEVSLALLALTYRRRALPPASNAPSPDRTATAGS
jgi:hypothetical protein